MRPSCRLHWGTFKIRFYLFSITPSITHSSTWRVCACRGDRAESTSFAGRPSVSTPCWQSDGPSKRGFKAIKRRWYRRQVRTLQESCRPSCWLTSTAGQQDCITLAALCGLSDRSSGVCGHSVCIQRLTADWQGVHNSIRTNDRCAFSWEYLRGHIPGALSLPLFDDDERAQVGTCFKHNGRFAAIQLGLSFVGPKLGTMVQRVQALAGVQPGDVIFVYCWRGACDRHLSAGSSALRLPRERTCRRLPCLPPLGAEPIAFGARELLACSQQL